LIIFENKLLEMLVFIILASIEILSFLVLKEHLYRISKLKFFISLIVHFVLSIWLWIMLIRVVSYRGSYDSPDNIRNHLELSGLLCAVVFPRFFLIIAHYSGKLFRIRQMNHIRWLTSAGMVISFLIFFIVSIGSIVGRFNFKTEKVSIKINGLDKDLDGFKIVQISDLHLSGFYRHPDQLQEVMEKINNYQPDLIINTGDFVDCGWREFDRSDTILLKAKSRYGNFAIFGNHDVGTYFPNASDADKASIILNMRQLIASSGYTVLFDELTYINIDSSKMAIIGVSSGGRHPLITHGDIGKATKGLDSVDFKLFLCHDPNQWEEDVVGKTDIDLTLSGHTHGMQIGIITKNFRWSPSKRYYPHWNGLFSEGDQYQYVNRGLGVLAVPFRIWMPPEITVIKLVAE
jgi:hypothetical protein